VNASDRWGFLTRNVRYLWLLVLFLPPGVAFLAYNVTPHEELWHEIVYSLLCVPLFLVWLVFLVGCVVSFLIHRLVNA
jgi:putative effector of murein hydrolase LrgA (UPF0299 family)